MTPFEVPVLFIVFNRPDTTEKVFRVIREIKPSRLFVAADGPRQEREGEKEKCEAVRKLVLEAVDWPCEVKTLFRDKNLGCGNAVSQAITWFFENVEEGIILEDDTLPDVSFFNFCKVLLEKYRDDDRIKMISGNNFQNGKQRGDGSYYFSAYNHIWGWATWRRAWKEYDFTLSDFTEEEFMISLKKYFFKKEIKDFWINVFRKVKMDEVDTWDYQWTFTIWRAGGLSVLPNLNLVKNIGFGVDATHTKDKDSIFSELKTETIWQINHPDCITLNHKADVFTSKLLFGVPASFAKRFKKKIKRLLYD